MLSTNYWTVLATFVLQTNFDAAPLPPLKIVANGGNPFRQQLVGYFPNGQTAGNSGTLKLARPLGVNELESLEDLGSGSQDSVFIVQNAYEFPHKSDANNHEPEYTTRDQLQVINVNDSWDETRYMAVGQKVWALAPLLESATGSTFFPALIVTPNAQCQVLRGTHICIEWTTDEFESDFNYSGITTLVPWQFVLDVRLFLYFFYCFSNANVLFFVFIFVFLLPLLSYSKLVPVGTPVVPVVAPVAAPVVPVVAPVAPVAPAVAVPVVAPVTPPVVAPVAPSPHIMGSELLNVAVEIEWNDGIWYSGKSVQWEDPQHWIHYDSGDTEWLSLYSDFNKGVQWRYA